MTSNALVVTRRRSTLERVSLLGGAAYVVLFVVGVIVTFNGQVDTGKPDNVIAKYWSDSGHRTKSNVGWILIALAILAFIWFVAALKRRVQDHDPDGMLAGLVGVGGTVYAVCALVSFSLQDAIKTMSDDTYHHQVYPGFVHAADDAGWVIHSSGAVGIATLIIATSIAARRAGRIPGWLSIVSIVVGVISLGLIVFFPAFLMLLWVLVTSIAMFVRSGRAPAPPA
jgi:uncharacterized membrane protein YhaH (DUF805 family)